MLKKDVKISILETEKAVGVKMEYYQTDKNEKEKNKVEDNILKNYQLNKNKGWRRGTKSPSNTFTFTKSRV